MRITKDHVSGLVYSRRFPRSSHHSESRGSGRPSSIGDWTCPNQNCNFVNFAKRNECFRCTAPNPRRSSSKSASSQQYYEEDDGSSQVGANPCNTVIIRGLDGLTTEQSLLESLALVTSLEPKNCYVMRNFSTGVSLGYAFMEFDTAVNGKKIRDHFTNKQAFEVDGKLAMIDYAKNTYSTILASIQYQNMDQQQQYDQYSQPAYRQPTEYELQALAASSANQMANIQQYEQSVQESQQAAHAANGYANLPQYPEPDTSQYQWDEASGYYYDSTTGLYYDANSQYYYNMTTQEYMYWDGTAKTYVPVKNDGQQQSQSDNSSKSPTVPEKPEKDEKKSKAKSIAKEMEKWAKSQNRRTKSVAAPTINATPVADGSSSKQTSADMAYDVLMGNKKLTPSTPSLPQPLKNLDLMPPPPMAAAGMKRPAPPPSGLVASYGGDESDPEEEPSEEANHIDRQKLTCNLCERKFNSTAILEKHVQMSDLHKQNLAKLQEKSQGQLTKQYRDRAKERRLKEGNSARAGGFLRPS